MRNTNAKNIVLLTTLVLGLLFLSGFGCQKSEEPTTPSAPDAGVSQVPEGWKTYTSDTHALSFAYPNSWHVFEDEKLGILVSAEPIPQPLPPDIFGIPMVIGVRQQNENEVLAVLQEMDPNVSSEDIEINSRRGKKYIYQDTSGPRILYFFPRTSTESIKVGIDKHSDLTTIQSILSTLSF